MFKYSIDKFIASKQKEKADYLFEYMSNECHLVKFVKLEELFDKNVKSYEFIEKLHEIAASSGDLIVILIIPRESNSHAALSDLRIAYNKLKKSRDDIIPYIEFSFPGDAYYKYGYDFQHVYILFFTALDFKGSCDCVIRYFLKLNNLKAFL